MGAVNGDSKSALKSASLFFNISRKGIIFQKFTFYFFIGSVWLYRGRRALEALKLIPTIHSIKNNISTGQDLATIILPARNEANNIRGCVDSLLNQDYSNLQIIVVNDRSTDETENILKSMNIPLISTSAPGPQSFHKIAYLNTSTTPDGWTGKNFAIHSAISEAKGKWLLFTDADTRHETTSLSSSIDHAATHDISCLTLLPRCITKGFFEKLIQPCAMGLLGLWFPMEKVNQPRTKEYFGNGQYLLIEKKLYHEIGGHEKVKSEFLEDYALARNVKEETHEQTDSHTHGERDKNFLRYTRTLERDTQH